MKIVAPNLGTLIGDTVAARLISHAGTTKETYEIIEFLFYYQALGLAGSTKQEIPIFHHEKLLNVAKNYTIEKIILGRFR